MEYPRYGKQGKSYKLTSEEIDEIKSLYKSGVTRRVISEMFKVSWYTIQYHTDDKIKERVKSNALKWQSKHKNLKKEIDRKVFAKKFKKQHGEYLIWARSIKKA